MNNKMNNKIIVWVMMILGTGSVAFAIPVTWGPSLFNDSETFYNIEDSSVVAVVDSAVYQDSSTGKYVYTYKITDTSAVKLSFFSVAILPGADVLSTDHETSGGIIPTDWTAVGLPVQSVEGLFSGTIQNGQNSVLLWFTSDYTPIVGDGSLFGKLSGSPVFASGEVHTPVPEPVTVFLLGTGGLMMWRTRRRIY